MTLSGDSPQTALDGQQGSVGLGSLGTGLENIAKLELKWRVLLRRVEGLGKAHIAAHPHCHSAHVQKGKDDAEMELMELQVGGQSGGGRKMRGGSCHEHRGRPADHVKSCTNDPS